MSERLSIQWVAVRMAFFLLFVTLASILQGCGSAGGTAVSEGAGAASSLQYTQNVAPFYLHADELIIDVAYEPGAEPFVSTMRDGRSVWAITSDNIDALFAGRDRQPAVRVPTALDQMMVLPAQNQNSWTADQLLNLASRYQNQSTAAQPRFFVMFLNGRFSEGGVTKSPILGVQVTGTTVIAIFKDTVRATSQNQNGLVPRYVEQATIVHEIGHALGLVNHGVPLTSEHHDAAHGAHCTNPGCVMYWQNDGGNDFLSYIQRFADTGNTVMFGRECIDDTTAYAP